MKSRRVTVVVSLLMILCGCGKNSNQSSAALTGRLAGKVAVWYENTNTCAVSFTITNNTQYHLNKLSVTIPNIAAFEFENVSANHSFTQNADADAPDKGCEGLAHDIESVMTQVAADTCSMDGVTEGNCQSLLSVQSDIDYKQIQDSKEDANKQAESAAMEDKKSHNHSAGDRVFVGTGGTFEIFIDADSPPGPSDGAQHGKKTRMVQGDNITIQDVEKDQDGIASWYKMDFFGDQLRDDGSDFMTGPMTGWIRRDDFDKAAETH